MIRVFLVEDHPVMREGYRSLIDAERDLMVCGEADSAEAAIEMTETLDFDVAVVDLSLPGTNGVEFLKQLRVMRPEAKMLVSSAHDEALYAERALRAGAHGYLMKYGSAGKFIEAIRAVMAGDVYLSESYRTKRASAAAEHQDLVAQLTDRELEVFEHFGRGKGTREVAEAVHLSVKTIESHRANIKRKLGLTSPTAFIQRAVLWVESSL